MPYYDFLCAEPGDCTGSYTDHFKENDSDPDPVCPKCGGKLKSYRMSSVPKTVKYPGVHLGADRDRVRTQWLERRTEQHKRTGK